MSRIENAAKRLKDILGDAQVTPLPEDQLIVKKNMVDNPTSKPGVKATTMIPGEDGYEIYAAVRNGTSSRPSQAQQAPPSSSPSLRLDLSTRRGEWETVNSDGQTVVIRANAGGIGALDEVNRVLGVLAETLL